MRNHDFIDVPVQKPWVKRWLARSIKASVVIGAVGFFLGTWDNLQRHNREISANLRSESGYRCAARLSDNDLTASANSYGTIDISKLGCSPASPFFVSMHEVQEMRAGKMDFSTYTNPFNWQFSAFMGIGYFVFALLTFTASVLGVAILRWVWR